MWLSKQADCESVLELDPSGCDHHDTQLQRPAELYACMHVVYVSTRLDRPPTSQCIDSLAVRQGLKYFEQRKKMCSIIDLWSKNKLFSTAQIAVLRAATKGQLPDPTAPPAAELLPPTPKLQSESESESESRFVCNVHTVDCAVAGVACCIPVLKLMLL